MGNVLAFAVLAMIVWFLLSLIFGSWGTILAAALLIGGLIAGLVSVMDRLDRLEKKLDERAALEEPSPENEKGGNQP